MVDLPSPYIMVGKKSKSTIEIATESRMRLYDIHLFMCVVECVDVRLEAVGLGTAHAQTAGTDHVKNTTNQASAFTTSEALAFFPLFPSISFVGLPVSPTPLFLFHLSIV